MSRVSGHELSCFKRSQARKQHDTAPGRPGNKVTIARDCATFGLKGLSDSFTTGLFNYLNGPNAGASLTFCCAALERAMWSVAALLRAYAGYYGKVGSGPEEEAFSIRALLRQMTTRDDKCPAVF